MTLKQKLKKIKLLILDVDGVLTNGRIYYGACGEEMKAFYVHDGAAIEWATRQGLVVAFLTGRKSPIVVRRARELGVKEVHQGVRSKKKVYAQLLKKYHLHNAQVCCVGDDLPDLEILKMAGVAVAPSNAVAEVKLAAHWVTRRRGGEGAVREVLDLILQAQGGSSKQFVRA